MGTSNRNHRAPIRFYANNGSRKDLNHEKYDLWAGSLAAIVATILGAAPVTAEEAVMLYKNPHCGCCEAYANYLRENGFEVEVRPTHELARISREAGIADAFLGCHTAFIGGYVVSGHVPVEVVNRMLEERPEIAGIALPGMPMGSPGMGGTKQEPFRILGVADGAKPTLYAVE